MGGVDRDGAGNEPKIDRLARLLADERVSRRQVITAGASAVLGITLFEPADTLASIAQTAKRCPKGETKCGKKCCAKGHVCCGTTCCAKGDTCKKTHKGKKVTHTCEPPKKPAAKPQCETAADCPGAASGSCQQATCTNGTCGLAADNSNVPAPAACVSVVCVAGAPQSTPLAAETKCGTNVVCDGGGHCVGCASAGDCPPAASGSCQKAVCNGGTCGFTADNSNLPAAATCMSAACVAGVPQTSALVAETSCGSGMVCDGAGHCVGCAGDGDCPAAASGSCQQAVCNGGTCGFAADDTNLPTGTPCAPGTCTNGTPGQANASDGTACASNATCTNGVCGCSSGYSNCGSASNVSCSAVTCANGMLTACGSTSACAAGYGCNNSANACLTSCSGPTDCASGYYCNSSSVCVVKLGQGAACTTSSECTSTFCVDGVCCNNACGSTCMACSTAAKGGGTDGICGAAAAGHSDPGCAVTNASTCGTTGTCNGAGSCAYYPSAQQCGAAHCSGSTAVSAQFCDGAGNCQTATTQNCVDGCSNGTCNP
jgi:hypothetical protein